MAGFGTDVEGPTLHTQNPAVPRMPLPSYPPTYPLIPRLPLPHSLCLNALPSPFFAGLLHWHPRALALNLSSLGMEQSPINTPPKVPVIFGL